MEPQGVLTDRELLALFFEHFGTRGAVRMFGWAVLMGAMGIDTWSQLERAKPPRLIDETTWYAAVRQFRKFRDVVAGREQRKIGDRELAERLIRAAESERAGVFSSAGVE